MKLQIRIGAILLFLWFITALAPVLGLRELYPVTSFPMYSDAAGYTYDVVHFDVYAKGAQAPIRCSDSQMLFPLDSKSANQSIAVVTTQSAISKYKASVDSSQPSNIATREAIISMWKNSALRVLKPGQQLDKIEITNERFDLAVWPPAKSNSTHIATVAY